MAASFLSANAAIDVFKTTSPKRIALMVDILFPFAGKRVVNRQRPIEWFAERCHDVSQGLFSAHVAVAGRGTPTLSRDSRRSRRCKNAGDETSCDHKTTARTSLRRIGG